MSFDNLPANDTAPAGDPFNKLRAALADQGAQTPEIVAIFQQIKNLRESDRSLRSIRRNLELDNMPVIEPVEDEESLEALVASKERTELTVLLESFLNLQKEKETLSERLVQMISAADKLEAKVNHLSEIVEKQQEQIGKLGN